MISLEGAALIATVYPIGVLILAVELRTARALEANTLAGAWFLIAIRFASYMGVMTSVTAVANCVLAVSVGKPMEPAIEVIVIVSGCILGSSVLLVLGMVMLESVTEGVKAIYQFKKD